MTTIGIDLGTRKIALAVFDAHGLVHAVAYEAPEDEPRDIQLEQVARFAHDFTLAHLADSVWIESVIVGNNRKYSIQLAQTLGAVLCELSSLRGLQGLDIRLVDNKAWKKEIVGNGNASKAQVWDYIVATHPDYALLCAEDQDRFDACCIGLYGLRINDRALHLHLAPE